MSIYDLKKSTCSSERRLVISWDFYCQLRECTKTSSVKEGLLCCPVLIIYSYAVEISEFVCKLLMMVSFKKQQEIFMRLAERGWRGGPYTLRSAHSSARYRPSGGWPIMGKGVSGVRILIQQPEQCFKLWVK